jgi:BTB/POZ domain-containing protein 3/6
MNDHTHIERLLDGNSKISDIRSAMVNIDLCSDVTFLFEAKNQKIKAHKFYLITASIVFHKMFCGPFSAKNEIIVTDIVHDDFLEVMNYIYGAKVNITVDNMLNIWYAAKKYLLSDLKRQCIDFVKLNIDRSNVLEVFNDVQLLDSQVIDDCCLDIILDSPYDFFEDVQCLRLHKNAFRKIMHHRRINCLDEDLKQFALKWLNFQKNTKYYFYSEKIYKIFECDYGVKKLDFENKQFTHDISVDYFSVGQTKRFSIDKTRIVKTGFELYGIGIYLGIDSNYSKIEEESIILTIEDRSQRLSNFILTKYVKVQQSLSMSIMKVMFKKIDITNTNIYITIDFGKDQFRAVNPLQIPKGNTLKMYEQFGTPSTLESMNANGCTCVAYLIKTLDE